MRNRPARRLAHRLSHHAITTMLLMQTLAAAAADAAEFIPTPDPRSIIDCPHFIDLGPGGCRAQGPIHYFS